MREREMHGREHGNDWLVSDLHNVAVTPLWLITSLRSLQSQPSSSSSSDQKAAPAQGVVGEGGVAPRDETRRTDGSWTLRLAEWLGKMGGK